MGSISYETYIQAIKQVHYNPKHLIIKGFNSNKRDSLKTIVNMAVKFKATVSQSYEHAQILSSELKRMADRKIQNEQQKNSLIRTICRLFEKFVNWKEKNGWNTNAELAIKISKLFADVPAPALLVPRNPEPEVRISQKAVETPKENVRARPPIDSPQTPTKFPEPAPFPATIASPSLKIDPTIAAQKPAEKPSPTIKNGTVRFKALLDYKNNPQEFKIFEKRKIWGDVVEVESKRGMQSPSNSVNNLKDLLIFMAEGDEVDLSNPVCEPFILDLFTLGKAQLMSDFTAWVVNQKGFNPNLLNSICKVLTERLAGQSKYTDAHIIDILLTKVRTLYQEHPLSCNHPNVLLLFKTMLKIDPNHGKAIEFIEWLREINKIDFETFRNVMEFFVEKNRDSSFEYPVQNVLLDVYKKSDWKEILDKEPSDHKQLIDYLNKLENPVKPVEIPVQKEKPPVAKTHVSRPAAENHSRTPTIRRSFARKDSLNAYQLALLQDQQSQLSNKTKGIVWGDIKSIKKVSEEDILSVEALILEMTQSTEIDFSNRTAIRIVRDALASLKAALGEELFQWVCSHPTFCKDIFLQCSMHYVGENMSDKKLPGLQLFMNGYIDKIHETLPLNDKDVLGLYSTLLNYASNDPQTEKQLAWVFSQPEFDLTILKTFVSVLYNKQQEAKKRDANVGTIVSSAMTALVDHLKSKTEWETTLQASEDPEDQKLMEYIRAYRE